MSLYYDDDDDADDATPRDAFQRRLDERERTHQSQQQERMESRDLDAIFSDDPDREYFKQMIEAQGISRLQLGKSMDDSIIGTETLAGMMMDDDNQSKDDSFMDYNYYRNKGEGKKSTMPVGPPPQDLSILGLDDDLSTIANDTINGSIMDNHSSSNKKKGQARARNFKEYEGKSPSFGSKERSGKTMEPSDDNEENTMDGPPPDVIQVDENDSDGESYLKEESFEKMNARSKKIYIVAIVLGFILLGAIGALAISLVKLRNDDDNTSSSSNREAVGTDLPTRAPITLAPSMIIQPSVEATATPTLPPSDYPTRAPQTLSPTKTSFEELAAEFMSMLAERSPESLEVLEDPSSPQFRALVWTVSDPEYSNYSSDRILQRYTLATLATSIDQDLTKETVLLSPPATTGRITTDSAKQLTWMTYTDECNWVTTHSNGLCDDEGRVAQIYLENIELSGFLPAELVILAESLHTIGLANNRLRGPIPPSYGKLLNLRVLDLNGNEINSFIPVELAALESLEYLGLSNSKITGVIPPELGSLSSLVALELGGNELAGALPIELGNLENLEILDVQDNQLEGGVPAEYGQIFGLSSFELDGNLITGTMPRQVCSLTRINVLDFLKADCHKIACECCTDCSPPPPSHAPTKSPTVEPTGSPTATPVTAEPTRLPTTRRPTGQPTRQPTEAPVAPTFPPTASPTECESRISTNKSCYTTGETIRITFFSCVSVAYDWVGMYPDSVNPNNFQDNYDYWVWTCGTQQCRQETQQNVLTWSGNFGRNRDIKLHLFRNSQRPYTRFASTPTIQIRDTC